MPTFTITISGLTKEEAQEFILGGPNGSASAVTVAGDDKPKTRRGRGKKADEAEKGDEPKKDEDKPRRRSRGGKKTEEPAAEEPESSDISDADLQKAARQGAKAADPDTVMKILDEFGVDSTNDLEGDQRQEFIDKINELEPSDGDDGDEPEAEEPPTRRRRRRS